MEFRMLGAEVAHEVDDITCQFAIAQSLQDTRAVRTESGEIFSAIRLGDERALQKLCAVQKDQFLERDGRGWIPLHQAASQKNITILQLTCKASGLGSLECVCHLGKTPLFMAVEGDLIENTCFLLQQGASPSCPDNSEDPPLLVAVRMGHSELVSLLLRWGVAVDQRGRHGRTALHEASRLGLGSLVCLLLEAGALPDTRSYYGLTPLALAAQGGHLEVVERLLDSGADVCSQAQDEASILFEACVCGDPALIRTLLQHGADANARTHTGHLPIHRAAHRGHLMALKLLIPVTSMECVHDSETSPLHASASAGHTHCIKALLDAGYDPNFMPYSAVRHSIEDERRTALFYAVSNNDMPCVKLLLDGGAMPNLDPVKCLQVALRMGNYEMINLLLRFGANVNYYCWVNTTHFPSALQYAFKDQVILRMLCNYGYDVERCFQCPYGDGSHVPDDFEGWSNTVIKDTTFCEVIAVYFLKDESGHVVLTMLDYVDHVTFCSKLNSVLKEQRQWPDICRIQENVRSLQHLCRLKIRASLGRLRLRAPVFMSFLPLPQRLKDYILYREYDLYRPEGRAGLL